MEMEELYGGFYKEILAYCTAMTKSRTAAEDLVQETYVRAFTHWDDFQNLSRRQSRAWLYKTARNLFIDQARRQSRETQADEEQLALSAFEEDLSQTAVLQLVGRLPETERAIFSMRYFEGYNSRELGEIFNLSPATIRSRLASAKRRLREWIEK